MSYGRLYVGGFKFGSATDDEAKSESLWAWAVRSIRLSNDKHIVSHNGVDAGRVGLDAVSETSSPTPNM